MFSVSIGAFQFDLLEGLYAAAEKHSHLVGTTRLVKT
jgi:hypothetical protein